MAINTVEEYEKVVNVSWFSQEQTAEDLKYVSPEWCKDSIMLTNIRFPCVLPFSQMYPLCCIDIRNFLNQFYFFSDDHFQHPDVIDETLRKVSDKTTKIWSDGNFADIIIVFGSAIDRESVSIFD